MLYLVRCFGRPEGRGGIVSVGYLLNSGWFLQIAYISVNVRGGFHSSEEEEVGTEFVLCRFPGCLGLRVSHLDTVWAASDLR